MELHDPRKPANGATGMTVRGGNEIAHVGDDEVERRDILNACDMTLARQKIDADPSWATRDLEGWCDHRRAGTLNYMAMLRGDAPRLGLTGPIEGTGDMTRLLLAAVFGMTDVLDALVEAGAHARSLTEAAAAGDVAGWPVATADPQERVRALIMAADHQRLAVIDELLEAGTPIDAVDPLWGRHPLRLAAERGRPASTRHLLERGADPGLTDRRGRTALDLCQGEHRHLPGPGHDAVAALLKAGARNAS